MTDTCQPFPHSATSEKAVLSAMMKRPDWIARGKAEGIAADSFHLPQHRALYLALVGWKHLLPPTSDGEVELIGFVAHVLAECDSEMIGGPSAICEIMNYAITLDGWPTWCETLREMKARRLAISAAQDLAGCADSAEAIQSAKTTLDALQRAVAGQHRATTAKQASADFISRYEADHAAGDIPGISTGIDELDKASGGMRPGELWIVGGKTSAGKSVIMLQIAGEFIRAGRSVAVFTLEMMAGEIIGRLVSYLGRVRYGAIMQPRTAVKGDLGRIKAAVDVIAKSPLWIDASAGQTSDSILTEAERIRDGNGGLSLVVVDYLQLIRGGRARGESREEEIARASGGLKQLAKHLGCPVLSATQLNEANQTRESRAIAQDADSLLLIEDEGIRIAKLRNGERGGLLPLILDGAMQRFTLTNSKP